ncbi:MAG TPA: oxidoreductase, partial [Chitinophagaceae bacterium]|nr:oxidoreductase [Chitinophagaceae bacterium]
MQRMIVASWLVLLINVSCQNKQAEKESAKPIRLITLDPGHFHAALVQKSMYDNVDSIVHVYAPLGSDLQLHLDRINGFDSRKESP